MNTVDAFEKYESIRHRLPVFQRPGTAQPAPDLSALTDLADVFVFDAYGVLNVGEGPISTAPGRIKALRAAGKQVFVLTNAASYDRAGALHKFNHMGFDFSLDEIISSRVCAEAALAKLPTTAPDQSWGVMCPENMSRASLPVPTHRLSQQPADFDNAVGFILLAANGWSDAQQAMLQDSLRAKPRPVIVANPDLVAPRETGLTYEPGMYAHALLDEQDLDIRFFGKPFDRVFDLIADQLSDDIPSHRIMMVGDTLHTDILGGNAQGWRTALVTRDGILANHDAAPFVKRSQITPDWVVPHI